MKMNKKVEENYEIFTINILIGFIFSLITSILFYFTFGISLEGTIIIYLMIMLGLIIILNQIRMIK